MHTIRYTKEYVFELAEKHDTMCSFVAEHGYASRVAEKKGWLSELDDLFAKKKWDRMKDVRMFFAFTNTKAYREAFDKFKETYVE